MSRVAVVCPGRGSYTERTTGALPRDHALVARADELRAGYGLEPLSRLDHEQRFSSAVHLRAVNASPLIWLSSLLEASAVLERDECCAVAGNSMGWYTAVAVAGALEFDDAFKLVQEMALLQEEHGGGGQLLYPVVDDDWRPDPARAAAVERALGEAGGEGFRSIELGGYAVLAGTDAGLARLMRALPAVTVGRNRYPLKLVGHGPYHTPLLDEVARRARRQLGDLPFRRPRVPLVDGRGARHTPWSADADALRDYTLGHQVTRTFDLTRALRYVLRDCAPDELVLPGPGNTLGGVCGQVLVAEGWRGVRSKADFEALQAGPRPIVRSLGR